MPTPLTSPQTNPTPIFELFRGNHATELLTAAVAHFHLFQHLAQQPLSFDHLRTQLHLAERPANVLLTALRAMNLLTRLTDGRLDLTPTAREHLLPNQPFYVGDYLGLAAQSPGVLAMVERLKTNRPAGSEQKDQGAAFIFREGIESAMESEASARHLTLALAGRAKNVAPALANNLPLDNATHILDVGGGTGIYSIALLQKHPRLHATVFDRAEVLKVASEFAQTYGVADRLQLLPGDMFTDPLPTDADIILLSNILHDWDTPECNTLIQRCATALKPGGRLVIHDVLLDDDLGGPLPIALYSASLFSLTEGRAYSAAEYTTMLRRANLHPTTPIPTLVHCSCLPATKPR